MTLSLFGLSPHSWFAIRHRPSGKFLPSVASYGFTRQEPTHDYPPRLFKDKHNATQALQWWLKGEAFETHVNSDADLDGRTVEIKVFPKPERRAADFEIVVIRLHVTTLEQEALSRL